MSNLNLPRETAMLETRELAGAEPRTFNEDEHDAIVAALVARETSALQSENQALQDRVAALESEKAELQTKVDTAEVAKVAAEQAFTDHKAAEAEKAQRAELRESRATAVHEAASHMPAEWVTEEKKDAWAAMEQAAFDTLVAHFAEVAAAVKGAGGGEKTHETAMHGAPAGDQAQGVATAAFWDTQKGGIR